MQMQSWGNDAMGDSIDRNEVIELLEDEMKAYHNAKDDARVTEDFRMCFKYATNLLKDMIYRIKEIPSKRETGHWTFNPESYPEGDINGHYECDQCGAWVREKTKYCPDCGSYNGGEE